MIITRLSGGLGNQMFQYAAGLALASHRRTVLKLDVSWFRETSEWAEHGRYALDGFLLPAQFSTTEENERATGVPLTRSERCSLAVARFLRLRQYERRMHKGGFAFRQTSFRHTPDFQALPDGTHLDGLFQSEQFFQSIFPEVRRHFSFRFPLSDPAKAALEDIRSAPSAFVHVRRGDYVTDPRFGREIGILGAAYYRAAIERLAAHHPGMRFHLFSDDPSGAARLLEGVADFRLVDTERRLTVHETLELMTACHHGITANSSFSWWAAWLIRHPGKLIIAPSPWYAGLTHDTRDLVPSTWQTLPAGFAA